MPTLPLRAVLVGALCAAPAWAQGSCTLEDFEVYPVAAGVAEALGIVQLDDQTVVLGHGPGLVASGASYSCDPLGELQWTGDGFMGLASRMLVADGVSELTIDYAVPVSEVDLRVHAYAGAPDTVTVQALDGLGGVLETVGPLPISGPVALQLRAAGIEQVVVAGTQSWSPPVDLHEFCTPGPRISLQPDCPGPGFLEFAGMSPDGNVILGWSNTPGLTVLSFGPCAGATVPLQMPSVLFSTRMNSAGEAVVPVTMPASGCGVIRIAAFDVASCTSTAALTL